MIDSLLTSFGPFGKTKIIVTSVGDKILSKDGQLLLHHLSKDYSPSKFFNIHLKSILQRANIRGDGSITAVLMLCSLYDNLKDAACAVHLLRAYSVIRCVINEFKDIIVNHFVKSGYWETEISAVGLCRTIGRNVITPAANQRMATIAERLIVSWLFPGSVDIELETNREILRSKITFLLNNIDFMILQSSVVSKSFQDSHVLKLNQFVIEGRIPDHSKFASFSHESRRMLCFEELNWNENYDFTMSFDSLNSFDSKKQAGFHQLKSFFEVIQQFKIDLIVTSEEVSRQTILFFATHQLYLVDKVPKDQLRLLAKKFQTKVYFNTQDFLESSFKSELSVENQILGIFSMVKRVHFFGEGKTFYLIELFEDCFDREEIFGIFDSYTQLIIYCNSISVGRMYKNLISRCLKSIDFSLRDTNTVIVPGGGAAELGWSLLWGEIGSSLMNTDLNKTQNTSFKGQIAPLVMEITNSIIKQLPDPKYRPMLIKTCFILRDTYLTIPQFLLRNALSRGYPSIVEDDSLPKIYTKSNDINVTCNRMLFEWSINFDKCACGSMGIKLGDKCKEIIYDPTKSWSLEKMKDSQNKTCGFSFSQFWDIFAGSMDIAITYLKIGGEEGIILTNRSKIVPKSF